MSEEKENPKQSNNPQSTGESKPMSEGVREDIAKNFERVDTSVRITKSQNSTPLSSKNSSTKESE